MRWSQNTCAALQNGRAMWEGMCMTSRKKKLPLADNQWWNGLQTTHSRSSECVCMCIQSLSYIWLFVTSETVAHLASLSFTTAWSLLKFMSTESVMLSNHLILYCPLLLLPSVFPSIRVFSNESVLHIRWPKYWSFSFKHQSFQRLFRVDFP